MKTKKIKFLGFTLVELIIVITILAILATVAFISFNGYTSKTRDTNRLANMKLIEKSLDIYGIKTGIFPIPDNSVTILSGTTVLLYQGNFSKLQSDLFGISNLPIDPLDSSEYTYLVNFKKNGYQLLGYLENSISFAFVNQTNANSINYTNRVPYTLGENYGIIMYGSGNESNIPIQKKYDINTFTGIDLNTYTESIKVIKSNNVVFEGTGGEIINTISTTTNTNTNEVIIAKLPILFSDLDNSCGSWINYGTGITYSGRGVSFLLTNNNASLFPNTCGININNFYIPQNSIIGIYDKNTQSCPTGYESDIGYISYSGRAVSYSGTTVFTGSVCKSLQNNIVKTGEVILMTNCLIGYKKVGDLKYSGRSVSGGYLCEKE